MSLQEQLAQSQGMTMPFPLHSHFNSGLLGNNSAQIPTQSAGIDLFDAFFLGVVKETLPPANRESQEMSWLVQNSQELGQFKGEWLLIQGQNLLLHSADFAAIRATIREQHIPMPFVYYVPTDEESNSITI